MTRNKEELYVKMSGQCKSNHATLGKGNGKGKEEFSNRKSNGTVQKGKRY